jgi:hypothetical protein
MAQGPCRQMTAPGPDSLKLNSKKSKNVLCWSLAPFYQICIISNSVSYHPRFLAIGVESSGSIVLRVQTRRCCRCSTIATTTRSTSQSFSRTVLRRCCPKQETSNPSSLFPLRLVIEPHTWEQHGLVHTWYITCAHMKKVHAWSGGWRR